MAARTGRIISSVNMTSLSSANKRKPKLYQLRNLLLLLDISDQPLKYLARYFRSNFSQLFKHSTVDPEEPQNFGHFEGLVILTQDSVKL